MIGCAIVYGIILSRFNLAEVPGETKLGALAEQARVNLYLQPIQVDGVNHSMQVQISVVPVATARVTIADRDFLLMIQRGSQVEHVQVRAGQPLPEVTYQFDLENGSVRDYPLDRYVSLITLAANEKAENGAEQPLPIHVTAWEGVLGYDIKANSVPTQQADELRLELVVSRTGAVSFFALAIYGAMLVIMISALTIASLVFLGVRRIEVTFVGALGAMIFALPALRHAMPGSPPFGVRADILVFFWAELGAVVALCLFIAAWARRGAQP